MACKERRPSMRSMQVGVGGMRQLSGAEVLRSAECWVVLPSGAATPGWDRAIVLGGDGARTQSQASRSDIEPACRSACESPVTRACLAATVVLDQLHLACARAAVSGQKGPRIRVGRSAIPNPTHEWNRGPERDRGRQPPQSDQ
jgi:hypothetical protein